MSHHRSSTSSHTPNTRLRNSIHPFLYGTVFRAAPLPISIETPSPPSLCFQSQRSGPHPHCKASSKNSGTNPTAAHHILLMMKGYDYVEASKVYDNLPDALDRLGRGQGAEMQAWLPETTTVADVGMVLSHHLTALIANTWSPLSSKHHLHALVCNLAARIPKKMAGRPSWEP